MFGSRSFYALWNNMIFEFQDKAFRDWFIDTSDAVFISSKDAYANYDCRNFIQVSHQCYKRSIAWTERNRRK